MVAKDVIRIIQDNKNLGMKDRLKTNLSQVLPFIEGNVIEIGAGFGDNTIGFCEVANNHNRHVLVIDPFESDWENMPESYRYPYEIFKKTMHPYEGLYSLCKKSSLDEEVKIDMENLLPIAFAYVDGLQSEEAVLSDLRLMEKYDVKLIGIDDKNRGGVKEAIEIFLEESKYNLIETQENNREAYLWIK